MKKSVIKGDNMKIEVTKEQYEAFQNGESIVIEPPKKEYVIDYEDGCYAFSGDSWLGGQDGGDTNYKNHGRYRKTRENTKHTIEKNKERNLLEALFEDIDGDLWEWKYGEINYGVYLDYEDKKWKAVFYVNIYEPGKVYTGSRQTAEKVCELLNNGQYSLD